MKKDMFGNFGSIKHSKALLCWRQPPPPPTCVAPKAKAACGKGGGERERELSGYY